MKSMLAKQSPQWPPTRWRQEMQTGGNRRSAMRPSNGRSKPALARMVAGGAGGASKLSLASPIGITP